MTKVRLTVTYVYEYEIKPEYYDGCETDEQRLEVDLESYRTEPSHLDFMDTKSMDIQGEILPEAPETTEPHSEAEAV